ncbi:MAG: 4Fe-4S dicluster domain-containing protein [Desulfovibrionaceae bacterium]|nr:4Fe-4S dicluster domain-containing protein [Desulfovibrionaceae bacterium]
MKSSRRKFLKLAAVSALGLGAGRIGFLGDAPAGAMDIPTAADYNAPMEAKHWGMAIDTTRFNQELVDVCATACHTEHNVPTIPGKKGVKWFFGGNFEETFPTEHGHYLAEDVEHRVYPLLCNQCEEPMCVRVCPTQATFKRADGIVMMDFHRCIGCRYCMAGCPFGARSFNFQDPRPFIKNFNPLFPTRTRGVVEKCNFCSELLAMGKMPACVEASGGALIFGDLDDPESDIRKVLRERFALRRKPDAGTGPSVYYLM